MKRSMLYLISMAAALLLAYTPAFAETTTDTVAATSVSAVSFSDALTLSQDVNPGWTLISLSLEDENGDTVYHAELLNPTDNTVYEVTLNSTTGQVESMTPSASLDEADQTEAGSSSYDDPVEYTEGNGDTGETENEQDDQNGQYEQDDQNEQDGQNESSDENEAESETTGDAADAALYAKAVVTLTQAQEIALSANPDAVMTGISLEDENGSPIYEIVLLDANGQQLTLKVDAITGAMLTTDAASAEQ